MCTGKSGKAPFITQEALAATLDAQVGAFALRNKAALILSHYLGLRTMELARLKVSDLWDIRTQTVVTTVRLLNTHTKGGVPRELFFVNERAREIVRTYLVDRAPKRAWEPLFASRKGGHFSPNTMQQLLAQVYAQAGIKASSHSGRRTFATRLIEAGADISSLQVMLGHKYAETTAKYIETNPLRQRAFAGLLT